MKWLMTTIVHLLLLQALGATIDYEIINAIEIREENAKAERLILKFIEKEERVNLRGLKFTTAQKQDMFLIVDDDIIDVFQADEYLVVVGKKDIIITKFNINTVESIIEIYRRAINKNKETKTPYQYKYKKGNHASINPATLGLEESCYIFRKNSMLASFSNNETIELEKVIIDNKGMPGIILSHKMARMRFSIEDGDWIKLSVK